MMAYNSICNTMRNSITIKRCREELRMVLLMYAIIPCLALVCLIFGTAIPTSFIVLMKKFLLHLFHWFFIVYTYINA